MIAIWSCMVWNQIDTNELPTQQIDNHLFQEHYLLVELNLFVGVSQVLHVFFS